MRASSSSLSASRSDTLQVRPLGIGSHSTTSLTVSESRPGSTLRPTLTLCFVAGSVTVLEIRNGTKIVSVAVPLVCARTCRTCSPASLATRSGRTMPWTTRKIMTDSGTAGENSDCTSSKPEGLSDGADAPIKPLPKDGSSLPQNTLDSYRKNSRDGQKRIRYSFIFFIHYSSELYCPPHRQECRKEAQTVRLDFDSISIPFWAGQK